MRVYPSRRHISSFYCQRTFCTALSKSSPEGFLRRHPITGVSLITSPPTDGPGRAATSKPAPRNREVAPSAWVPLGEGRHHVEPGVAGEDRPTEPLGPARTGGVGGGVPYRHRSDQPREAADRRGEEERQTETGAGLQPGRTALLALSATAFRARCVMLYGVPRGRGSVGDGRPGVWAERGADGRRSLKCAGSAPTSGSRPACGAGTAVPYGRGCAPGPVQNPYAACTYGHTGWTVREKVRHAEW